MKVHLTSAVLMSGVVAYSLLGYHGAFAAEEGRLSLADDTVHVNGLDIFYRIGGSGPPLLLLHGFTGVGHDWDRFLDEFGQHTP
ncbi:MAG: alpha/beta fold hydrolase [Planctomycetota bacterium]